VTTVELALTSAERDLLAECETVIERGMGVFVEVGAALMAVRDNRLYRVNSATFEEYCSQRWALERAHAYRLINSAQVVKAILSPIGDKIGPDSNVPIPATESQARELAPLLGDPDKLREVWTEAVGAAGGKPTAEAIAKVREARSGEATPTPEPRDAAKAVLAKKKASEAALLRSIEDDELRNHEHVSRFVHAVSQALKVATAFDAERIADLVDEDQVLQLTVTVDALARFAAEVKRRRSGLRLVGGTAS